MRPIRSLKITLALAAGLTAANVLAAWYLPARLDLTHSRQFTLAVETRQLLENLPGEVQITLLLPRTPRTEGERQFAEARGWLLELLHLYQAAQPLIQVRDLDPQAAAEAAQVQQRFPDATPPCLVLAYGTGAAQRHEVLGRRELWLHRPAVLHRPAEVEFRGEQAITAALSRLTSGRSQTVLYVLTGHGELSLELHAPATRSLSRLAAKLRDMDYDVRPCPLLHTARLPADADVLLIAGPEQPLQPPEIEALRTWLIHGGRIVVLGDLAINPLTGTVVPLGWEELLAEYALQLGNDRVLTKSFSGRIEAIVPAVPTGGEHPLARALATTPVPFFTPRSVRRLNSIRQAPVLLTPLLQSYPVPQSWAEADLNPRNVPQPGGPQDLDGPVTLGVAVEKLEGTRPRPALVVFGDSEFIANPALESVQGAAGFRCLLASLNWLRGRRDLFADIPPQKRAAYRLSADPVARRRLVWLPTAMLGVVLITAGSTVWYTRRQG